MTHRVLKLDENGLVWIDPYVDLRCPFQGTTCIANCAMFEESAENCLGANQEGLLAFYCYYTGQMAFLGVKADEGTCNG